MDQSADSVSEWFGQLKAGDEDAAQKLWSRYSEALLQVAKRRLGRSPRGIADEEDVALSVFDSIFRGAAAGRFGEISTRDELWWLLLSITNKKAVDHIRREGAQKRLAAHGKTTYLAGNGVVISPPLSLQDLVSSSPSPDFLVALEEEYARLLDGLRNDQLREIAALRIEGYTAAEIAPRINIGLRATERKLKLIRGKWKREFFQSGRKE